MGDCPGRMISRLTFMVRQMAVMICKGLGNGGGIESPKVGGAFRDGRFPRSRKRDHHPTNEDLFLGTPDLGHAPMWAGLDLQK